jgi:hypothetical protein
MFNRQSRRSFSKYVSKVKKTSPDVRQDLKILELLSYKPPFGHSHPLCAEQRTAANISMVNAVQKAGYDPFLVSMSKPDQIKGFRGTRMFYTDKDLKLEYRDDTVLHNDVIIMVDVDYHAPMDGYLRYFRPIMMYTLQPKHAAYTSDEYSYYIEENRVHYSVKGGARYVHEIWDYDHDVVSASYNGWTNFFEVDQRVVATRGDDGGHRLITLVPFARLPDRLANSITATPLRRKQYSTKGVSMVCDAMTKDVSISLAGSRSAVRVPLAVYSALQERLAAKQTGPFTVGDVEVFLSDKAGPDKKVASATVYGALSRIGLHQDVPVNLVDTQSVITTYRPIGSLALGDEVTPCQTVSAPIVSAPALFPARCHDSAEASVKGRVLATRNDTVPGEKYVGYARDFVHRLIPNAGRGLPLDIEEVIAKQNGPLQRGRIKRTQHNFGLDDQNRLEAFVKAEAYQSVTDPRNITTCRPEFTVGMSRYVYAFKQDILFSQSWYGPGKSPVDAIKRFQEFGANGFIVTDYSRFDGTVSRWLQETVVRAAYLRWIDEDERQNFRTYFDRVFIQRARTDQGFEYDPGYGTRSGSPITTDGNTMVNAFVHYSALRSAGFDDEQAWNNLGLFAGDDGLAPNEPRYAAALPLVVRDMGLTVKMEITLPNERITYLGRVFPHPLTHADSHQEVMRTLSKIHLSANKAVTPEQAAVNKATGYLVTDARTPLIGDWARKIIATYPQLTPKRLMRDEEWKVESGAWPQQDQDVINDSVARELGYTVPELLNHGQAILAATDVSKLPVVATNDRDVKIEAVVGDVVVSPVPVEQCQTRQERNPKAMPGPRPAASQPKKKRSPRQKKQLPGSPTGSPPLAAAQEVNTVLKEQPKVSTDAPASCLKPCVVSSSPVTDPPRRSRRQRKKKVSLNPSSTSLEPLSCKHKDSRNPSTVRSEPPLAISPSTQLTVQAEVH